MGNKTMNATLASGVGAGAAGLAMAALKTAGISAVKHSCGKFIATKLGLYTAGTLGLTGGAVAALPVAATVLTVTTTALAAASALQAVRK